MDLMDLVERLVSKDVLVGLSIFSGAAVALSLLVIPFIMVKLPPDYLKEPERHSWLERQPAAVRIVLRVLKNVVGLVLLILGIAMLLLPGQGILTIILAITLLDFPGRVRWQRRIMGKGRTLRSINWLRGRFGRPPLLAPSES